MDYGKWKMINIIMRVWISIIVMYMLLWDKGIVLDSFLLGDWINFVYMENWIVYSISLMMKRSPGRQIFLYYVNFDKWFLNDLDNYYIIFSYKSIKRDVTINLIHEVKYITLSITETLILRPRYNTVIFPKCSQ